ncbi:hypothetical protein HEP87_58980 [Streptomyces sp. S1D4-11]
MSQHASARQHHKHALDVAHPPPRPGTPRAVLVPVAVVLLIGSVFVSVYLAAFHAPRPHELRVGTTEIGTHQAQLRQDLAHAVPDGFTLRPTPTNPPPGTPCRTGPSTRPTSARGICSTAVPMEPPSPPP